MPQGKQSHHPRYKVVAQEQTEDLTPQGERQKMWTVHLEHENGTRGTVELPDHLYSPENVHALASEQAQTVHAVGQLPDSAPDTEPGQPGA